LALDAAELTGKRVKPQRGAPTMARDTLPTQPSDPFSQELARLTQEAIAVEDQPEASLPLLRAFELRERLPSLAPLAQLYQRFSTASRVDPRVRELAAWHLAQIERQRGRLSRSDEALQRLGFVTDFLVIGPFDNEGKGGCDKSLAPETEIDLGAEYLGKVRPVRWRRLPAGKPALGQIALNRLFTPDQEIVSYAFTEVDAESDQSVLLSLSTSGASALFIDGQRVFEDAGYHPQGVEQARLQVALPKGRHQFLLKLCQATSGQHGFSMRLRQPNGRPLQNVRVTLPEDGARLSLPSSAPAPKKGRAAAQPTVKVERLDTLADTLRLKAERSPRDPKTLANHAELAKAFHPDDETARTAVVQSARAAALAPSDPEILWLAARLADDWNEERGLLDELLKLDPGHARATERLAARLAKHGQPRRALDLIDAALAQNGGDFALSLQKAMLLSSAFDLSADADRRVETTFEQWRDRPEVILHLALLRQSQSNPREALALLRTYLSLKHADLGARRQLAAILGDLGDLDAALDERHKILALDPWNSADWLRLGELAAANGRSEEALGALERARAIGPDDPQIHERAGHALASMGRTKEAIAALESALALRPQNARLKEALNALKGGQKSFGEALAQDVTKLIAQFPPRPGQDGAVLAQLTAIQVHPSGLASRFHQVVARAQTPRGVEALRQHWVTYADDRQEIKILTARIHRPDGSVLESFNQQERSLSDPSTRLYYDARARLIRFPALAPGDVLELAYRLDDTASDNMLSDYFGDVRPIQGELVKERFDVVIQMPQGRKLHANTPSTPIERTEESLPDGGRLYRFTAREVPRFVPEPGMPGAQELISLLHVSTYETWDEIARYYEGLVHDQLTITPTIREAFADIVKPLANPKDELAVIRAVYDFVVSRTRYVGLEFGIHGFKPYPVDKVLSRRFGDCKDKASLMHALLQVGGIDSKLVLLRMKRRGALAPYPASLAVFDHAILYLPKHDLFLDGTAEHHGTTELPVQDAGAAVLVIDPSKPSALARIPELGAERNASTALHEITLSATGEARIQGSVTQTGQLAPSFRRAYLAEAKRAQDFERTWSRLFPGASVRALDVGDLTAIEAPVRYTFELTAPGFAKRDGDALIVLPLGQRKSYVETLAPLSERSLPLELWLASTRATTYRVALPEGFVVDGLPSPVELDTPLVHFARRCEQVDGRVELAITFTLKTARVEPADYAAFRESLARIDALLSEGIRLKPSGN
jgi:tetratricopeptide (TPR) repeat protein